MFLRVSDQLFLLFGNARLHRKSVLLGGSSFMTESQPGSTYNDIRLLVWMVILRVLFVERRWNPYIIYLSTVLML
jgi:hypothetical protein